MAEGCIVIGGTQRSGTSILARVLHRAGVDFGTEHWDDRVGGGFESPSICSAVGEALGVEWFPYHDFPDLTEGDERVPLPELGERFDVQKFSPLLMHPEITRAYLGRRGKAARWDRVVLLWRAPGGVVRSKTATPEREEQFAKDAQRLHQSPHRLAHNVARSYSVLLRTIKNVTSLHFPEFLRYPNRTYVVLKNKGVPLDDHAFFEAWHDLVDTDKINERV